jgi:hypothetical protein
MHPANWGIKTADAKFSVSDLYKLLVPRVDDETAIYDRSRGRRRYWIVDSELNESLNYAAFLILHGDRDVPRPALLDMNARSIRYFDMDANEAGPSCAHLVISTQSISNDGRRFYCALEYAPGISRTIVENFLTKLFAETCKNQLFHHIEATGEDVPIRPIVKFIALPSDSLEQAILEGRLRSLTMVKPKEVRAADERNFVSNQYKSFVWNIQGGDGNAVLSWVRHQVRFAKRLKATEMRLKVETERGVKDIPLPLAQELEQNTLINKVSVINLDTPVEVAYENIRQDLLEKVVNLLDEI